MEEFGYRTAWCKKLDNPDIPPGGDQPDETYDVSTPRITSNSTFNPETTPEVAVLFKGFPLSTQKLLESFNEPTVFVDIVFSPVLVNDYPYLIIPTGGLYGLDSLPSFKSNLEQYVEDGGTLIVFSQQHGYEYSVLPGGYLSGFGWLEDQSCHHGSVYIDTYHPVLSGQDSVTSDVTVDGYFTKYPDNATRLLSRIKNGMPAMLMYEYGNGTVIASTIYTDWAYTHYQATQDGKNLVRDIIAWAKNRMEISEYGRTDTVNISVNVTNMYLPLPLVEYSHYELGETVDISVNVTNYANITSDKVSFEVFDPDDERDYVNVSVSIPANETNNVNFTYPTTNESKRGIYFFRYSLYTGETLSGAGFGGRFTLGVNTTNLSSYKINFSLSDPNKEIVKQENISVYVPPGEIKVVNFTYANPSKLGLWNLEYDVLDYNNSLIDFGAERFAISKYAENPEGWVYQGKDLTYSVSSDSENYAYGSDGTFTIQIWNHGDADKTVTCWWSFPHNYWAMHDPIYGSPGTTSPGHKSNLYNSLTVPAHGDASFIYSIPVYSYDRLWADFYEGDETSHIYLGKASRGFYCFRPSVAIDMETNKNEYAKGENVHVLLNHKNKQSVSHNFTVTVKTLDSDNNKIFEDSFNINLNAGASENKTLNFLLPTDAEYGTYVVTAEAYENGNKIGSDSTYFEVPKDYIAVLSFDKPDNAYKVRQNMSVYLNITNVGAALWNSTVNISIPDLAFEDSKFVVVNPNETEKISYNLSIPENIAAGKHDVIVTIGFDDSEKQYYFVIPDSNLVLSAEKTSYNAGEYLDLNLTNIGGVDTECNCSLKFYDPRALILYENDTIQKSLLASEIKALSFMIPEQAVSGGYYLLASCNDLNTGRLTKLSKWYDIRGLKASLTSKTDKKAYCKDENISILTNITNLDGAIVNGSLNLKIVCPYIPNPLSKMPFSNANKNRTAPILDLPVEKDIEFHPYQMPMSINESGDNTSPHSALPEHYNFTFPFELEPSVEEESNESYQPQLFSSESMEIGNETVWKDEVKILNENLIIKSTGNLTLINTTLIMNCSSDGEYSILHWNGGEMHILNKSNITAMNPNINYRFLVGWGSTFEMRDSELHECGVGWPFRDLGLWINTYDVIIENNSITNNYVGITLYQSYTSTIVNNDVSSNHDNGIHLYDSSNNNITGNNVCSNHDNGIHLAYSNNNNITGNNVCSNYDGICLRYSNNNNITGNNVCSNTGGYGICLFFSSNNNITGNNACSNLRCGIFLSYSDKNNITSNNACSNNYGIALYYPSNNNNNITGNNVSSNNYGIYLPRLYGQPSCDNLIYNNYFSNNKLNAFDNISNNIWNITKTPGTNIVGGPWLGGNYWSDYNGTDVDGDGLGDTLLPYNCSRNVIHGGDYLPLIKPEPIGKIIWETNITIDMAENETKNIVTDVPMEVLKNVTGKIELISTLYSDLGQIIAYEDPFFYITDTNTSLVMETDKWVYKPNETIAIYGEVKNHGSQPKSYNLSIKKDGAEIFADAFTLNSDQSHEFAMNTSSNTSFTLEGTVDGVTVTDLVSVETASINVSIIAPDVVGINPFNVGVLIENVGRISADLNVSINSMWNITVPEGESRLLEETTMSITKNTTLNVTISGDVNQTYQKGIFCGENARINITPEPTYLEGTVDIPYIIENIGVLDSEFNATFSIDDQTILECFFVPKGQNITDSVSFNLTIGSHLLQYLSPFEDVNTTINVLSAPEFVVTSIYPADRNFTIGEDVTLVIKVENRGGSEGEAVLSLEMPDFEDTNRTWIRAGAKENISFNLTIPDDLEEKNYKGFYKLDGTRGEFTFFVQGANISVDASLDKSMYAEGETAVLTLELTNECSIDLDLYSRVKFNEYDNVQNYTLSGSGTQTLVFYVPANFTGDNKMLYTVYMDSGRSLYINSIYIYKEQPDVPLRLFTDKDVYNMGDVVTIHIVDVTGTDVLNLTAPNFTYNDTVSGPMTLEFTLPELRSCTYYIEYGFGNFSSAHPFDVRGYSARIIEAGLDKEVYNQSDEIRVKLNVETNQNISGVLKMWIYDPKNNLIEDFEMDKDFVKGENEIKMSTNFSSNLSGIHMLVYGIYTHSSLIFLASGAEYFDVWVDEDTIPPTIESVTLDAYTTIPDASIHVRVEATDNVGVTSVTADGINLTKTNDVWDGNITVPSATGYYTFSIRAEDAAGNFAETTVEYSVVRPEGGLGVAALPRFSNVTAGSAVDLKIKIVSTENFDDLFHVHLTNNSDLPPDWQADLAWFNWTSTYVEIPSRGEAVIPLRVEIPADVSGHKAFRAVAESTKWSPVAFDSGIFSIT